MPTRRRKPAARPRTSSRKRARAVSLLVATRKGAFIYKSDPARRAWKITGPIQLGAEINHLLADPREPRRLLMASKTGHLGPTVFRSADAGRAWKEAARPPAFPKVAEGQTGPAVSRVFWLTPGHDSQPGVWYAASGPPGLFRSEDHGDTWAPVSGFNDNLLPRIKDAVGAVPGGDALVHSLRIDPRDARHMYIGLSVGGIFESMDAGRSWKALNKGVAADFLPDKDAEYGHDPHTLCIHPMNPDRLYHQNHCGIYRLDRPGVTWSRIGDNMPKAIGDIGFPLVLHPRDPETLWVLPMDGTTIWPRTSVGGKPAVYRSRNGGRSWQRQDKGLPRAQAWLTTKRQAMSGDDCEPLGLYFGTTGGEVWASRNEGESWTQIGAHLPEILSIAAVAS